MTVCLSCSQNRPLKLGPCSEAQKQTLVMLEGCNCSSGVMFLFSLRPRCINSKSRLTLGLAPEESSERPEGPTRPSPERIPAALLQHRTCVRHICIVSGSEPHGKFVERHRTGCKRFVYDGKGASFNYTPADYYVDKTVGRQRLACTVTL